jgi:hypothetical protein
MFALFVGTFSLGVAAQTATSTAPAAAPIVAPNTCVKPEYPGRTANESQVAGFNRDFKSYGDCVKKYVEQNKAIAEAAAAAANKVVEEYNSYSSEIKAKIDAENNTKAKDAKQ